MQAYLQKRPLLGVNLVQLYAASGVLAAEAVVREARHQRQHSRQRRVYPVHAACALRHNTAPHSMLGTRPVQLWGMVGRPRTSGVTVARHESILSTLHALCDMTQPSTHCWGRYGFAASRDVRQARRQQELHYNREWQITVYHGLAMFSSPLHRSITPIQYATLSSMRPQLACTVAEAEQHFSNPIGLRRHPITIHRCR